MLDTAIQIVAYNDYGISHMMRCSNTKYKQGISMYELFYPFPCQSFVHLEKVCDAISGKSY